MNYEDRSCVACKYGDLDCRAEPCLTYIIETRKNMKQWTRNKYVRMLEKNGFAFDRCKGSHSTYTNKETGCHITVGRTVNPCVARRMIKENKLNINLMIYERRTFRLPAISYWRNCQFSA